MRNISFVPIRKKPKKESGAGKKDALALDTSSLFAARAHSEFLASHHFHSTCRSDNHPKQLLHAFETMATAKGPSSLTRDNIKFIAIARATDKAIVACYIHSSTRKPQVDMNELTVYKEMLSKVIRAPTWKSQVTPNGRHSLECDPNKFHFTMDNDELVFAAITAKDYPIRLAFQMIAAVQQEIVPKFGSKALTCREVRAC